MFTKLSQIHLVKLCTNVILSQGEKEVEEVEEGWFGLSLGTMGCLV